MPTGPYTARVFFVSVLSPILLQPATIMYTKAREHNLHTNEGEL